MPSHLGSMMIDNPGERLYSSTMNTVSTPSAAKAPAPPPASAVPSTKPPGSSSTPSVVAAPYPCAVEEAENGALKVTFEIEPATAARLKKRAESLNRSNARYLWEEILRRAVETTVW